MKKRKFDDADSGFSAWGGYMEAKITKLEEQFAEDALNNPYKESDLFAGISIFVNGLTNPSADELKRIMMKNGGVYHTYQRPSTNFIIATNLPDVKIRQITTAKIVSPLWIMDCLKENRILDYSKYLLYTNCKVFQPKINFTKSDAKEQCKNDSVDKIESSTSDQIESNEPIEEDILKPNESMLKNLSVLNNIVKVEVSNDKNPPIKSDIASDDSKKGGARSAVDPNFLTEFYNNSRLHLISTLGANFKNHIGKLRETHNGSFPARDKLQAVCADSAAQNNGLDSKSKVIMHIDMDCFFVSVGLRSRPHLIGHPVAVTHSKGGNQMKARAGSDRQKEMELYTKKYEEKIKKACGINDDIEVDEAQSKQFDNTSSLAEIASCSYEARKMGISNGMFVGAALKLCPNLKTMPYDFDAYKEVAYTLYDTIAQYTLDIEAVSCDEMYVDLTDLLKDTKLSITDLVFYIRNEITARTQCLCSAGVGANRLQARMATKKAKPNGQFYLDPEDVESYFSEISVSDLPGVGYSTNQKLNQLKVQTCSELQAVTMAKLQQEFGKKLGESLYQHCRGIDYKSLTFDQVRKSVSVDVNYGIRFTEEHQVDTFLNQLCTEIHSRLTEIHAKGKTITLKFLVRAPEAPVETAKFMGCGYCDHVTKSTTLQYFTDDLSIITRSILTIKNSLNLPPHELRGVGIQITKLNTGAVDQVKSNILKKMFNRVKEKKATLENVAKAEAKPSTSTMLATKLTVDSAAETNSDNNTNISLKKDSQSLRKVKSFSSTGSRDIHQLITNMDARTRVKLERIYEDLDLSTLAELPEDIRIEVLREQRDLLKLKNNRNKHGGGIKCKSLDELKATNEESTTHALFNIKGERISRPEEKVSDRNFLLEVNWREILLTWLENVNKPTECDSQMIADFFKELLIGQMLEELYLRLKFIQRKISETTDCVWHQVYYKIINPIQNHMAVLYGKNYRLFIKSDVGCKDCFNPDYV